MVVNSELKQLTPGYHQDKVKVISSPCLLLSPEEWDKLFFFHFGLCKRYSSISNKNVWQFLTVTQTFCEHSGNKKGRWWDFIRHRKMLRSSQFDDTSNVALVPPSYFSTFCSTGFPLPFLGSCLVSSHEESCSMPLLSFSACDRRNVSVCVGWLISGNVLWWVSAVIFRADLWMAFPENLLFGECQEREPE